MDLFEDTGWVRVDLAYTTEDCFCGPVYRKSARLWLYDDLASIVLLAAKRVKTRYGIPFILYDGLRTVEAQKRMQDCPAVRANPHWLAEATRVLSPPGIGGHPRAMAIDITLDGCDMGTAFDEFPEGGNGPDVNRAHRLYKNLPADVLNNRQILEDAMVQAARDLKLPLLPLPVEWWDFRFPAEFSNRYAPLDEVDLPPQMRMTDKPVSGGPNDLLPEHFDGLTKILLEKINRF